MKTRIFVVEDENIVAEDIRERLEELNGIETAIVIQSFFEEPLPVVFLTGFSEKSFPYLKVLDDYIYINKPYTEDILLRSIERALKQRQP